MPFAATWMDLEIIILHEVRKKRDTYLMISHTHIHTHTMEYDSAIKKE